MLSIVVPAYNEDARIAGTLAKLWGYLDDRGGEIIVADDGSTDGTAAAVEAFRVDHPDTDRLRVRLLPLPHRGKGGAVRMGMLIASGDDRLICDADLSMPVEEIDKFLEPSLAEVDVIIGSREAPGARRFNEPAYRHIMGRVFNGIVQLVAVRGLNDTQCGFKLFRAEAADRLFRQQTVDGWGFDVEILFLAQRAGYRIAEVPIDWYYGPNSKVEPVRDTFRTFADAVRVRWNAIRGRYH